MSIDYSAGWGKITKVLLPIQKYSRAAPEPLGWRKCPWLSTPVGHSKGESAIMVMFSCKPAGSLLGWTQAGAYVNFFYFQACILDSTVVSAHCSKLGPRVFSRCCSLSRLSSHSHSSSMQCSLGWMSSLLYFFTTNSPATCWGSADCSFPIITTRSSFLHRRSGVVSVKSDFRNAQMFAKV